MSWRIFHSILGPCPLGASSISPHTHTALPPPPPVMTNRNVSTLCLMFPGAKSPSAQNRPEVLLATSDPLSCFCFLCLVKPIIYDFWGCCSVAQSLSPVQLFATPWTAAGQASLSFTVCWSLLKLMTTESAMPSNHLAHCCPLLLLPSIFPGIRLFTSGGQSIGVFSRRGCIFSACHSPGCPDKGWISLHLFPDFFLSSLCAGFLLNNFEKLSNVIHIYDWKWKDTEKPRKEN